MSITEHQCASYPWRDNLFLFFALSTAALASALALPVQTTQLVADSAAILARQEPIAQASSTQVPAFEVSAL